MRPGYTFGIGVNVDAVQFRHMDTSGREINASAEGETQRRERIGKLQDQRLASGAREAPPVSPAACLAEWMVRNPLTRTGPFGKAIAERGEAMIPRMAIELPGRAPVGDLIIPLGRQHGSVTVAELPGR